MKIFLKSGEAYFSDRPAVVTTVLGSCVAITMFSPSRKIGAICHGILPRQEEYSSKNRMYEGCFKYIDCAVQRMARKYDAKGITRSEVEVKIFGGAEQFLPDGKGVSCISVGSKNVEQARLSLGIEGFKIIACDTGGPLGRKMAFYTHTGDVILRRLGQGM